MKILALILLSIACGAQTNYIEGQRHTIRFIQGDTLRPSKEQHPNNRIWRNHYTSTVLNELNLTDSIGTVSGQQGLPWAFSAKIAATIYFEGGKLKLKTADGSIFTILTTTECECDHCIRQKTKTNAKPR